MFFMLRWDQCSSHKKHVGASYVDLVLLHPVGYAGHVVHCGVSGAQIVNALFFLLGWAGTDSRRSASTLITPNLYFHNRWDLRVM
jgi:hypothetical protein